MLKLFLLNRSSKRLQRASLGFTLIELIIAIAIAAVLLGLAIPSFTSFLNSSRVTSQANELLAAFQVARMEAIRRNARVVVCASSNAETSSPPSCDAGSTWNGWIVYSDTNGNNVVENNEVIKVGSLAAPTSGFASSNIASRIIFSADGFARTAAGTLLEGTVAVCVATTSPAENVRDVSIDAGSRTAVAKRNGSGACNTPPN